jgi:hypothetical protein
MSKKYQCPCCRNSTLDEQAPGTYQICPMCGWEDDLVQFNNHDFKGGANIMSLNEARIYYRQKRF